MRESIRMQLGGGGGRVGAESSATAVNEPVAGPSTAGTEGIGAEAAYGSEEDMVPMSDEEVLRAHERLMDGAPLAGDEEEEVVVVETSKPDPPEPFIRLPSSCLSSFFCLLLPHFPSRFGPV